MEKITPRKLSLAEEKAWSHSALEDLKRITEAAGQTQLLKYAEELKLEDLENLQYEVKTIDWDKVKKLWSEASQMKSSSKDIDSLSPWTEVYNPHNEPVEKQDHYSKVGMELIVQSKLAVCILGGGQSSRLGCNYPKGMYDFKMKPYRSIFELHAKKLCRVLRAARVATGKRTASIPLYIMTSGDTLEQTEEFWEKNEYFGFPEEDVVFFPQENYPCLTEDGKAMLRTRGTIAMNPNGNGGVYSSMMKENVIKDMYERGVLYVQVFSVDNILARLGDFMWAGYFHENRLQVSNKVCKKRSPTEKVGVMCLNNGACDIVEYSEITPEMTNMRTASGELAYGLANIAMHMFSVDFLKKVAENDLKLPIHRARKKILTIDENGNSIMPEKPNGIKLEHFIFDSFRYAKAMSAYECKREEEFAPIKNKDGPGVKDCPATARAAYESYQRKLALRKSLVYSDCLN